MINTIRKSRVTKVIASYLAIQMIIQMAQPMQLFALTSGPSQPEFNSFTPIGTSDMVNLSSGDFNYNIPIMDVGGYPLNLAYDSGITMDQEASWVGLGWNLNVGQIARNVRGIPDDFSGDQIRYENNMKTNKTYGAVFGVGGYIFGNSTVGLNAGLGIQYNNYNGISFMPSFGMTFNVHDNVSLGFNVTGSDTDGASINPSLSLHSKKDKENKKDYDVSSSLGVSYNSRQGLSSMSLSTTVNRAYKNDKALSKNFATGSSSRSFVNNTYTPTKRTAYANYNASIKAAVGGEVFGVEVQGDLQGYASYQGIRRDERNKLESAYGYENTEKATQQDILDFNREKDRSVNEGTRVLPVTNYTYDLYAIQGQGIGGQFRPFRSQVSYVFDQYIADVGGGAELGLEFGAGNLVHAGVDVRVNGSSSYTGVWKSQNNVLPHLQEKTINNQPDYQKVYYKRVGEMNIDKEISSDTELFVKDLSKYNPIRIGLGGKKGNFYARNQYEAKKTTSGSSISVVDPISKPLKRKNRILTTDAIQKKTVEEISVYGNDYDRDLLSEFVGTGEDRKNHHVAEINILQKDGARYIYGKAAYNSKKVETTFNISGRAPICNASVSGLVNYNPNADNSGNNKNGNEYFNRITTPAYAHTYLLSSVLSSDYEDLTDDGPTIDDLGAYTKFTYVNKEPNAGTYKWRIPFQENTASYNEGLKSDATDDMGNYVYGEKELLYANTIETKTHIAKFYLSPRKDGFGVKGENGGIDINAPLYKLDRVALFSKPEYDEKGDKAEAIKVAHFEYDYSLVPDTHNSTAANKGKLTLQKVFFTYRNSEMGRYTPYTFTYDDFNPSYNLKNYDVWGNYKDGEIGCGLNDPLNIAEFPYTEQNKEVLDRNVRAWTLKSIGLPSGGRLAIETESDDYQYVQNKGTMRMFKVVGVGDGQLNSSTLNNTELYNSARIGPGNHISHLYVEVDQGITDEELKDKMIAPIIDQPIYFRFLLNMRKEGALGETISNSASFDYVTGYLFMDADGSYSVETINNKTYAAIPIETAHIENNIDVNPISKAGFNFARKYLNNIAYSSVNNKGINSDDPIDVLNKLMGSISSTITIFRGPNLELMNESCARRFIGGKSWIRLMNPYTNKLGGGCRVKSIQMYDQWDVMTNKVDTPDNPIYGQFYGQEYTYALDNGSSSGVATYEPLISKENPFVEPIFETSKKGRLLAPEEDNFVEKPFGESFFPSPAITYSRVEVKNLQRKLLDDDGNVVEEVKKHATGKVINEFFTSFNYPTQVDYTAIDARKKVPKNFPNPLYIEENKEMALSQGFTVHTNDMNGKMKSQKVYAEGKKDPISGVDYIYQERPVEEYQELPIRGKLNNVVKVINANGTIDEKLIGVEFDVINDFRENGSSYESLGFDFNIGSFLAAIFPVIVPFPLPNAAKHTDEMKSVSTTKVIHSSGILKEKIAYDLGSKVSTRNLAWDANTGDILVTETVNEYGDQYYNLNYPAYWAYKGMGQASQNLDLEWEYEPVGDHFGFIQNNSLPGTENAEDYLEDGDEITTTYTVIETVGSVPIATPVLKFETLWVTNVGYNGDNSFKLMDRSGKLLDPTKINLEDQLLKLKVMRSGYRNQQSASMASITLMEDPIVLAATNNNRLPSFEASSWDEYRIVNTSAVEYSDLWATQCEVGLPKFDLPEDIPYVDQDSYTDVICFNPYIHNVRGDWRAKRSYAYLTGRQASGSPKLRKDGFFTDFKPLYTPSTNIGVSWELNESNKDRWTFASAVTQYSPFGAELENKDALDRYSSAQYGYNYTLPTAVSSNSKYQSMGFDGFEDYETTDATDDHFGFKAWEAENPGAFTTATSHTGTASIAVPAGGKATLTTQLVPCPEGNPDAVDDVTTVIPGESIVINVTANDDFGSVGPSDSSIIITSQPQYGTASVDDNGTPNDPTDDKIVYFSEVGYEGIDTLEYEICGASCTANGNGSGNCDIGIVRLDYPSIELNIESCFENCNTERLRDLFTFSDGAVIPLSAVIRNSNSENYMFEWSYTRLNGQNVTVTGPELTLAYDEYITEPEDLFPGFVKRSFPSRVDLKATNTITGQVLNKTAFGTNKGVSRGFKVFNQGELVLNQFISVYPIFCDSGSSDCGSLNRFEVYFQGWKKTGGFAENPEILWGAYDEETPTFRVSNNTPFCYAGNYFEDGEDLYMGYRYTGVSDNTGPFPSQRMLVKVPDCYKISVLSASPISNAKINLSLGFELSDILKNNGDYLRKDDSTGRVEVYNKNNQLIQVLVKGN